MGLPDAERRLAAIMFTDIVGYTALMGASEETGLRVRARHREVIQPLVELYRGEWIEETGDESLSSFQSAVDAVNCALAVQEQLRDDPELRVRIGIHLGETLFDSGRLYGDGVNVASRIRPLAEPGGTCISAPVWDAIKNQENVEMKPKIVVDRGNIQFTHPVINQNLGNTSLASPGRKIINCQTDLACRVYNSVGLEAEMMADFIALCITSFRDVIRETIARLSDIKVFSIGPENLVRSDSRAEESEVAVGVRVWHNLVLGVTDKSAVEFSEMFFDIHAVEFAAEP